MHSQRYHIHMPSGSNGQLITLYAKKSFNICSSFWVAIFYQTVKCMYRSIRYLSDGLTFDQQGKLAFDGIDYTNNRKLLV